MAAPDFTTIPVYEIWGPVEVSPGDPDVGWAATSARYTDAAWATMNAGGYDAPRAVVQIDPDGTRTLIYETAG